MAEFYTKGDYYGGGGGGGHTIITASSLPMAGRSNLQFNGANVTDDENNDTTVVDIPQTTFNGRSGSVLPVAGDYSSNQITLSSVMHIGGETQSNVTEALSALEARPSSTFNGRSGSILPIAGDYNSSQITHNSTSNVATYLGVWTPDVSCSVGAETATITNANIHTTSIIAGYAETASGAPVNFSSIETSEGEAVITFTSALEEAASIKLHILNI